MDPLATEAIARTVAQLGPEANGLVSRLLGPAADELGLMLLEKLLARRQKNLDRIAAKASAQLNAANPLGLAGPTVDTRTAVALLQGASLEDKGSCLENKWAGLLASAATGVSVPSSFPAILSQMVPNDAAVLDRLGAEVGRGETPTVETLGNGVRVDGRQLLEAVDTGAAAASQSGGR